MGFTKENTMQDNLYNLAFERSILSTVVFEPEAFTNISSKLSAKDFYLPSHQNIFTVMQQLTKQDQPIDEEFIKKELMKINKFDEQVMLEILSANPISNIDAYLEEVKNRSLKRETLLMSSELRGLALDDNSTNENIIDLIASHVDSQSKSIASLLPSNLSELLDQLSDPKLLSVPKDLRPIDGVKFFYRGGMHVIHGLSKAGKTYFALETLNNAKDMQVIWLDGDLNDIELSKKFSNIKHLAPLNPDTYLDKFLNVAIDYSNVIFIIDSLKDFKNGQELDTNNGMDTIIKRLKQLTKLGATVIVVHHSTKKRGIQGKPDEIKIKGNEEAIYSNSDITYLYKRDWETNVSELICERSRINSKLLRSGTTYKKSSYDGSWSIESEVTLTNNSESKKGIIL